MNRVFTRRARALVAAGGVALLCGGCFVFDELDEGQQLMDQHRKGGPSEASESEAGAAKEGPGFLERAQGALARVPESLRDLAGGLSRGAGFGGDSLDSPEQMVRCEIGGSLLFTRRVDCEARGGRVAGEIRARTPDA